MLNDWKINTPPIKPGIYLYRCQAPGYKDHRHPYILEIRIKNKKIGSLIARGIWPMLRFMLLNYYTHDIPNGYDYAFKEIDLEGSPFR